MKKVTLVACMVALTMLFTVAGGFALPNSCGTNTVLPANSGVSPDATDMIIAVAANFNEPLLDFLANYFLPQAASGTTITVCSNSTGAFVTDLNNNPGIYDFFFAANTAANGFGSGFTYAWGIPVLFGYTSGAANNIVDLSSLLITPTGKQQWGVGQYYATVNPVTATYSINTLTTINANMVAVADLVNAPYGQMAETIMNAMTDPTLLNPPAPAIELIQFNTVTNVQNMVGTNIIIGSGTTPTYKISSGFISKSQICPMLDSSQQAPVEPIAYVQFTGNELEQAAALINGGNTTAVDLYDYINDDIPAWNTFIQSYCYGPV